MTEEVVCPFCRTSSPYGIQVCRGCNADITYGPIPSDGNSAGFAVLFLLVILGVPSCNFVAFYGNPRHPRIELGLVAMIAVPVILTVALYAWKSYRLRNAVRFFRR